MRFHVPLWVWAAFLAFVAALLMLDLLVIHRKPHEIPLREAVIESAVWIALGLGFTLVILWWQGGSAAGEYLSGYLIEESLSIDNVFVWAIILSFFAVPQSYRFRVLFWGIFGALVFRAAFIFAGVQLIERFEFVLYFFGALLLVTAVRIVRHDESQVDPENNLALRAVRRLVPTTNVYDGQKLFTRENGRRMATPLFAVLVMVETTDIVFAVDSIPAIFGVAREPFIIFSSNAFAILGLRALYFCLNGLAGRFRYLNIGLGVILAFVGTKMILETADVVHFPTWASLLVIAVVITSAIVLSLRADKREGPDDDTAAAAVRDHS
ncbi:MAG: TerC family protein [Acidimicrobiia bacterium]|nr:TerC family protein [Acidimicrobiia bacterium]